MVEFSMIFAFFAGLFLLLACGDWLVEGAATLSRRFKLSPVFIGVVVIGLGTSLPEIVTTFSAALKGQPDMALGNVVGSNIANIALIFALGLLLYGRAMMPVVQARFDYLVMIGVTALFCALGLLGPLEFMQGLLLVMALMFVLVLMVRRAAHPDEGGQDEGGSLPAAVILVCAGLAGLFMGGELLVKGSIAMAQGFGISAKVIGLTLMAVGTSLPELAATLAAARKREGGMILGNILGSNIMNLLAAVGPSALIHTLPVGHMAQDMFVMVVVALMMGIYMYRPQRSGIPLAVAFLVLYAGYVGWLGLHLQP